MNRRALLPIGLAIVVGFYVVGLWPFNFKQPNNAEWISGRGGIHFERYSVVYSEHPLLLKASARLEDRIGSFTIELWLQGESEPNSSVPHIFSLYNGQLPENLVIGQWKSELLVRAPIPDRARGRGYREIGVESALRKGHARFVTITGDAAGTAFYLDGVFIRRHAKYVLPAGLLQGQIILGTSATGDRAWRGNLFGLAILNRSLGDADVLRRYAAWIRNESKSLANEAGMTALYLFDEGSGKRIGNLSNSQSGLQIPSEFHAIRKTILLSPRRDFLWNPSHLDDIAVNIVGFVPFGLVFYLYGICGRPARRIRSALLTLLMGAAVSLSIELIQVILPSRSSSLMDLLCNIVGTVLGILLGLTAARMYGIALLLPRSTRLSE